MRFGYRGPVREALPRGAGLIAANRLTSKNGLKLVAGQPTMNGLVTRQGLRAVKGLDVDCNNKTAGVDCSGKPDGLLSAATGMMSNDNSIATAGYMLRCALPQGDAIRVEDYKGGLVTLRGELGLAPQWKTGQCDGDCQERISACLMAFTNGDAEHIDIELAAPFTLGTDHSFTFQEAAFYGNIFADKPSAFYCIGRDYYRQDDDGIALYETRSCEGYNEVAGGDCPYVLAGFCDDVAHPTYPQEHKCTFSGDAAASCTGSDNKVWKNPITTFRAVQH